MDVRTEINSLQVIKHLESYLGTELVHFQRLLILSLLICSVNYFSLTIIADQHNKFFKTQNMKYIMLATYHKRRYYATEIDERSSIEMSYLKVIKIFSSPVFVVTV